MSTTLLAVDDSVTMRKVLEITFAGEEFRVITAESPDAALKKVRSEKPTVVLVDVTLPEQDGYSLCKAIKAEAPGLAVIIMSSRQKPYDAAQGSAVGADDFVDKPFDTQQTIEKVKKAIQAKAKAAPPPPPPEPPPQKPGAGTMPGSNGPATRAQGSLPANPPPRSTTGTSPGSPAPPPKAPTPGAAPPRTATLKGLDSEAATAQQLAAKQQSPTRPAIPAQIAQTPAPAPTPAPGPAISAAVDGQMSEKLSGLGLTPAQAEAVLALSREVVERVVWEVVPVLAETLIKEEIKRLTSEG